MTKAQELQKQAIKAKIFITYVLTDTGGTGIAMFDSIYQYLGDDFSKMEDILILRCFVEDQRFYYNKISDLTGHLKRY